MVSILLIDPDIEQHCSLQIILAPEFRIVSAYTGETGLERMKCESPEIVLLSMNLPDIDALDLLQLITSTIHSPPVIMISENEDLSLITRSIRIGAYEYLKKPLVMEKLKPCLLKALYYYSSICRIDETGNGPPELSKFIGESRQIQKIKRLILRFAPSNIPILIAGESGTGKEIAANSIHALSTRNQGPFIAINCGAIPPTLINSELFGSEKGAFTDAVSRPGSFEQANRGTLFLDEIGEMDLRSQVHLLRIIENQEIIRTGGIRKIPVDVRIVTATNKNLQHAVNNREFRNDLFYRINTFTLTIPPLRERICDIPYLAGHFIASIGKDSHELTLGALYKLTEYSWPGNVRELKATIERASMLTDNHKIEARHILFNQ